MSKTVPAYFDPETIAFLKEVLDDAYHRIPPTARVSIPQSLLAERILKAAGKGERDRERLIDTALNQELAA